MPLRGHVRRDIDSIGQLRDRNLEAALHLLENLSIVVGRGEGDRKALSAKAASTTHSVKIPAQHTHPGQSCEMRAKGAVRVGMVRVGRVGHVVVDNDVDALDVNASATSRVEPTIATFKSCAAA